MTESVTLKKALHAIKKLKRLLKEQQQKNYTPIAIVGLSCRFPEVNNKDEYWQLLIEGKNIISDLPAERWNLLQGSHEAALINKAHVYKGGFLKNIAEFDPYFFGITPREAIRMDPQQRLLLQVAYEAFEDAGLSLDQLAGSNIGVFASLYASQFAVLQRLKSDTDALYIPTGNATSMAGNRISYLFDLRGPSMVFDTACSSSLVSLHLACLHLQTRLCKTALVCAANINLAPSHNLLLSQAKMLSPDGQCKTFDAHANGYVQGEGIGAIILKPLSDALENKDRIYGVIIGSAINQDGKTNGLTAPNGLQQEALLKTAYEIANIEPHIVSYVECHGTGTFLGDPIETQALGEIIGKNRHTDHPCWIGSVKTNIGHLEPAAGIASIIKVALALKYQKIPPHLNFNTPNPHIDFDKYHFRVPLVLENWPKYGAHRIAGISGFGFGGTNAHIVIRELSQEENQQLSFSTSDNKQEIFTLSAKDPAALKKLINDWLIFIKKNSSLNLAQICFNLHTRRSHYTHRLAIITTSLDDLTQHLYKISAQENLTNFIFYTDSPSSDLIALAQSYVNKELVNWSEFEANRAYPHLDMPLYAWQNQYLWPTLSFSDENNDYPFSKRLLSSPLKSKQFEFQFNTHTMPEIADTYYFLHAGYYIEMLAFANSTLNPSSTFKITELNFTTPIFVPEKSTVKVQLILEQQESHLFLFTFFSYSHENTWTQHATGSLSSTNNFAYSIDPIEKIKNRCFITDTAENFFSIISSMNMPTGNSIRWTQAYYKNKNEILCELETPSSAKKHEKFQLNIHVGVIDGCIQSLFLLLPDELHNSYIASHIGDFTYYGAKNPPAYLYAKLTNINLNNQSYNGDFYLLDKENHIIAECKKLSMTQLGMNIHTNTIGQQQSIDLSYSSKDAATQKIIGYLTEQVANIFSMPSERINIHQPLQEMGIDSLMSIALSSAIKAGLNVAYPMQSLLTDASINDITHFVLNNRIALIQPENVWHSFRTRKKHARSRLFCFPYGGSGASIYRDWQHYFADTIEICPIQLPGRENRLSEAPIQHLNSLVEILLNNLEFDLPFSFFGHSFGALVAFELARALSKQKLPCPQHLFVSAFPDPRTPTKSLDKLLSELNEINIDLFNTPTHRTLFDLSEEKIEKISAIFIENGLTEFNNQTLNSEAIKILLPIFIADMNIVKNYCYTDESPLEVPITVFAGKQDLWVQKSDHTGWVYHTKKACIFHEIDGGHLFIRELEFKKQVIQHISNVL